MKEPKRLINLTYEQAVIEKNKFPSNIVNRKDGEYIIIIAPNSEADFKEFYTYFYNNSSEYTDKLCLEYSKDGKFQVREHLLSSLK
ncbi:hypothetical protein [Soonwooa purpurea]